MGLCKCSKKRVTNQFCFEHKVNVCENCMTAEGHQTCIVGPYLKWLENSNFEPTCSLCQTSLSNSQCVRFCCYHIFHTECVNQYGNQMPPTTAPAGYICTKCTIPIFSFNSDKNSPVASELKRVLLNFPWAREGLADNSETMKSPTTTTSSTQMINNTSEDKFKQNGVRSMNNEAKSTPKLLHSLSNGTTSFATSTPISMNHVTSFISSHSDLSFGSTWSMRNKFETERRSLLSSDTVSEDKYRNRSRLGFISRWFRSRTSLFRNNSGLAFGAYTRLALMGVVIIFLIITLLYFFAVFGRIAADNDPMLNPENNPNFREVDDS